MVAGEPVSEGAPINDISVRILGPIEVERAGRLIELSGRRERAVLALLLVHAGRVVPIDQIADELWDGSPPPTAVTSLRSHVSRVRKALAQGGIDDVLVTGDAGYALRVDAVRLDAREFEARAAEGRALLVEGAAEEAAARLGGALGLWRGSPFGDLGTSAFARAEATRLEEAFKTAREDRIEADLMAGRHREVAAELEALVVAEPLRERLWGQRMLALYRCGRQADALRAYGSLRGILAEHLGISPSTALQQLEVSILCQDPVLDLDAPSAPVVRPPVAAPPAPLRVVDAEPQPCLPPVLPLELRGDPADGCFVGRAAELRLLEETWQRASTGTAERVFLSGEPGIGKTTLAVAVAGSVHRRGGAVLLGRCDPDALTPYQPFVEALRRFVQTCSAGCLLRQSASDLREVSRLVPELLDRVEGIEPVSGTDEGDRYRLFEAVTSFITTVASAHPVLLVLDDLHWADKPTALLLRHLVRRAHQAPLLVLGTFRDVDIQPGHPMSEVLADLRREQGVHRVPLGGLDHHEIGALVADLAPDDDTRIRGGIAEALLRDTAGNPFFVREVLRHLQSSGPTPSAWVAALADGTAGLPDSIREVVQRRVGTLSSTAAAVLSLASVVGVQFDLHTIEQVGGLDPVTVLDAVEAATSAGLLAEVPRRTGWYRFTHALIREALYGSLSAARRSRLHGAIGEALEARRGPGGPTDQELAHHFLAAGEVGGAAAKALAYSHRAGEAAMDQLAYEEAVLHLERAVEVQEAVAVDEPAARLELLLLLGHAYWRMGSSAARTTFERAATEARAAGDAERFARAVVGLGLNAGGFASSIQVNEELLGMLEEALEGIGPADSELRVRLLARLAIERYFTPLRHLGRVHGLEAVAIAERLADDRSRLVALHATASASFAPSEPPAARLALVGEISTLADRLGDQEMAYRAEVLRQQTLLEIGDVVGAEATHARMERLVDELRMPRFLPWVRSYGATHAFVAGRLDEADALAAEALSAALDGGADTDAALALIGGQQMALRLHRDGLEPFAASLQAMADELSEQDVVLAMLPVLYRELDQPQEAIASHRAAAARRDHIPRDGTWLIYAWALGVSCRFADGEGTARGLYEELLPYADRWAVSTPSICFGPVSLALAGYASVLGWHDAALAHVDSGLTSARAAGAQVFVAAALVERAEVLLARAEPGDAQQARSALNEATHIGVGLGLAALLARARRLAAPL